MFKIFSSLIIVSALFVSADFAQAQSACPAGYYAKDDVCCSSAAEAPPTGSYGGKAFCFKRVALPPEKVCQKVPGETPGIWCKQSDTCGYGSYSVLFITYEFDLCITPPPPGPTVNIGSIRDNQTNTWTALFCNANTEEAGPAGVPYNAFYCQPKKNASGQIIAPPDRQSCVSGTDEYAGENWCCPEGQQAMVQPRGTPYCALLPIKLNVLSPVAGQKVTGTVPIKVKLIPDTNRPGVGKFRQLNVAIKSVATGAFLTAPAALTFEAGVPDNSNQGTSRTYTFNWSTAGLRGDFIIYVSATDDFGNTIRAEPYSTTVKVEDNSIKSLSFFTPQSGNTVRGVVPVVAVLDGVANTVSVRLGDFSGPIMSSFSESNGSGSPPAGVAVPKTGAADKSKLRYFTLNWDTKNGPFAVPNGWRGLSVEGVNTSGQRLLSQHLGVIVDNPQEEVRSSTGRSDDRFGPSISIWAEPSRWTPGSQQFISFKTTARDPDGISQLSIKVGNLPSGNCQGFGQTELSCLVSGVRATSAPVGTAITVTATDNSPVRRSTTLSANVRDGSFDNKSSGQSSSCRTEASSSSDEGLLPKSLSGVSSDILTEILNQNNQAGCEAAFDYAVSGQNIPSSGTPTPAPSSPVPDIGSIILQLILKILGRGLI